MMKKCVAAMALAMLMGGCIGTEKAQGPQASLDTLSEALTKKDAALFLSQFDMQRYVAAKTETLTNNNEPLRFLDNMGKSLGLGSLQGVIGLVSGVEGDIKKYFQTQVSTGELVQQCTRATTADCPWVPASLEDAVIKEISPTAAVAGVTTPANILSWLALANIDGVWKIVASAPLESEAVRYAVGGGAAPASQAPKESVQDGGQDEPAPPPPPRQGGGGSSTQNDVSPPPSKPVRL